MKNLVNVVTNINNGEITITGHSKYKRLSSVLKSLANEVNLYRPEICADILDHSRDYALDMVFRLSDGMTTLYHDDYFIVANRFENGWGVEIQFKVQESRKYCSKFKCNDDYLVASGYGSPYNLRYAIEQLFCSIENDSTYSVDIDAVRAKADELAANMIDHENFAINVSGDRFCLGASYNYVDGSYFVTLVITSDHVTIKADVDEEEHVVFDGNNVKVVYPNSYTVFTTTIEHDLALGMKYLREYICSIKPFDMGGYDRILATGMPIGDAIATYEDEDGTIIEVTSLDYSGKYIVVVIIDNPPESGPFGPGDILVDVMARDVDSNTLVTAKIEKDLMRGMLYLRQCLTTDNEFDLDAYDRITAQISCSDRKYMQSYKDSGTIIVVTPASPGCYSVCVLLNHPEEPRTEDDPSNLVLYKMDDNTLLVCAREHAIVGWRKAPIGYLREMASAIAHGYNPLHNKYLEDAQMGWSVHIDMCVGFIDIVDGELHVKRTAVGLDFDELEHALGR